MAKAKAKETVKKKTNTVDANVLCQRIIRDLWMNTQAYQKIYHFKSGKDTSRKVIRDRFIEVGKKFLGIDKKKTDDLLNQVLGK